MGLKVNVGKPDTLVTNSTGLEEKRIENRYRNILSQVEKIQIFVGSNEKHGLNRRCERTN